MVLVTPPALTIAASRSDAAILFLPFHNKNH